MTPLARHLRFLQDQRRRAELLGRTQEAERLTVRIVGVLDEIVTENNLDMAAMRRMRERFEPKQAEEPVLRPMGMDEYIRGQWIHDEATHGRRAL